MVVSAVWVVGSLAILALIFVSAFFSSSEISIFSLESHRVDALVASEDVRAIVLERLRSDPHRLLVTVLVGNNVANIAAASIATALLVRHLPAGEAVTLATVFTSCFVLVLGEIAPKAYGVSHAESWALRVARPLALSQRLLGPVVSVFEGATGVVNRVTGADTVDEGTVTREDLERLLLTGVHGGVIDSEEERMIRGVFDLREIGVTSVMVPRPGMIAVSETASLDEIIETCKERRVTRVPVYRENRDAIVGVVHVLDLLSARDRGHPLASILAEPLFVPETKPVDELLTEMRESRITMAIVIDEFGATAGLITLEDVVEEIVGEIIGRREIEPVSIVDGTTATATGRATVAQINEVLGLDLPTGGNYDTLVGFLTEREGRLLETDETVTYEGVRFTVERTQGRRILGIRIETDVPFPAIEIADGTEADDPSHPS